METSVFQDQPWEILFHRKRLCPIITTTINVLFFFFFLVDTYICGCGVKKRRPSRYFHHPVKYAIQPTPDISIHDPTNLSAFDPPRDSKSYPENPFTHSSSDDRGQSDGKAFRTARSKDWESSWSPAVKGDSIRYGRYTLVRCRCSSKEIDRSNFLLHRRN